VEEPVIKAVSGAGSVLGVSGQALGTFSAPSANITVKTFVTRKIGTELNVGVVQVVFLAVSGVIEVFGGIADNDLFGSSFGSKDSQSGSGRFSLFDFHGFFSGGLFFGVGASNISFFGDASVFSIFLILLGFSGFDFFFSFFLFLLGFSGFDFFFSFFLFLLGFSSFSGFFFVILFLLGFSSFSGFFFVILFLLGVRSFNVFFFFLLLLGFSGFSIFFFVVGLLGFHRLSGFFFLFGNSGGFNGGVFNLGFSLDSGGLGLGLNSGLFLSDVHRASQGNESKYK